MRIKKVQVACFRFTASRPTPEKLGDHIEIRILEESMVELHQHPLFRQVAGPPQTMWQPHPGRTDKTGTQYQTGLKAINRYAQRRRPHVLK
jgi:hypothetical protein